MNSPAADAVIVGGGIVGAACAEALAREGMRVTLLERGAIGAEGATAAGMGHIVAMDDSEAQLALTAYSARLWEQRRAAMPAGVEYEARGTLWIAEGERQMRAVRDKREFYARHGVTSELLDARQLALAEPQLRPGFDGALHVPSDSVIYASCAARWLAEEARRHRAEILEGVAVESINPGGVRLAGTGERIAAGVVVLAAGAGAAAVLGADLPVRPRKGHLAITDRYPGFVRHQLVELGYLDSAHGHDNESVAFNIQPRSTGQVLIGSSRQYDAVSAIVEPHMLRRMLARAVEFLPALERLSVIRCWTGFRAATPDSLPLIGPHPARPGLFLATGHEGLGITTSLGTAALAACSLLGRTPEIPAEPYLPSRFAQLGAQAS